MPGFWSGWSGLLTRTWWVRHGWQHVVGGLVWFLLLSLVPPTADLSPWVRLYWVAFIQGIWERYQREYDPTYPLWSMVGDWTLAVAGGALLAAVWP